MHLMTDLETYGTKPSCAVFSIGAKCFNPTKPTHNAPVFYTEISLQSCLDIGLKTEQSTLDWWKEKGGVPNGDTHIHNAIGNFLLWLSNLSILTNEKVTTIWANSPSFDYVILKYIIDHLGLQWPYPYYIERDVRTLKELAFPEGYSLNNSHNALADCHNQIRLVQTAYHRLGLFPKEDVSPFNPKKVAA